MRTNELLMASREVAGFEIGRVARLGITSILLAVVLWNVPATADDICPPNLNGDPLNIHQVMVDFGNTVGDADSVASEGARDPNAQIEDADLSRVVQELGSAIACTQAVLDHPSGAMLPDHADTLSGADRDQYVAQFLDDMQQFHDGLTDFRKMFSQLLAEPAPSRQYRAVYQESEMLEDLVNDAHQQDDKALRPMTRALTPREPASLQQNMKQIGQIMRTIVGAENDSTQNSANAVLATQVATLFTACRNQVPDAIAQMGADQRAAALQDYQSLIDQETTLSQKMSQAFANGQNSEAADFLQQMMDLSQQGHDKYKI